MSSSVDFFTCPKCGENAHRDQDNKTCEITFSCSSCDWHGEPVDNSSPQESDEKDYYLLFVWRSVEPKLLDPYKTIKLRDEKAKELKEDHGDLSDYYQVEVSKGAEIDIDCYAGDFFE